MCSYSLPIGCVYPHRLECGFTQDVLSRIFSHGRVAHKYKFAELPLILRGQSLGQSKGFGSLSQLDLLMSLAKFHLAVFFLESKHHAYVYRNSHGRQYLPLQESSKIGFVLTGV